MDGRFSVGMLLQIWGGGFFLLNKIFFWRSEVTEDETARRWRIAAWTLYLIGAPAWWIIFANERNWIAMALEISGTPSMVLGLVIALRGVGKKPVWLDRLALVGIVAGLVMSIVDFGGINSFTQLLELALVAGFLVGTYMLAKKDLRGYIGYMVMNGANAWLMYEQDYPALVIQQLVSLGFVIAAYRGARRLQKI